MGSRSKQILERAIQLGILTPETATALAKVYQAHKRNPNKDKDAVPSIEKLGVELGVLTPADATRLVEAQTGFDENGRIGGYELHGKIGSGAMGTVYKARQVSLDRVVAIKVLSPHLSHKAAYVERFLREARAVARLNHPNVISGIDVGEEGGVRYFVMEYAAGTTVGKLLDRGGAMTEARTAHIALQIARALDHAHHAGLVHRDVKPDNILLTKDGVAKLCDLGLAKAGPESGRSLGTPSYISPEQAEGIHDVDIRSDLYSLGATIYHMLVGTPPFTGAAREVMVKHLSEPPLEPRKIDPDVSETMEAIVLRLLEKDPARRFQTPAELVAALSAYEEGRRQVEAQPRAPVVRRRRRRRR